MNKSEMTFYLCGVFAAILSALNEGWFRFFVVFALMMIILLIRIHIRFERGK